MKATILYTIILSIIISIQGMGQNGCDITKHYDEFISVQKSSYNGNSYLSIRVTESNKKSCISEWVNSNPAFFDYLLSNFSSNANHAALLDLKDSIAIRKKYFDDLKKDSLFNSIMVDLINKTINKKTPKDSITMDQLLDIAVKYFSIIRINEDGYYVGKICVGYNDIKKTEKERKPIIEAFAFSSILKHIQSEEFKIYDDFVKSIKELYKINFGIDKEERLLRAQGAMYVLMKNSDQLRKMLKSEYEKQKQYLPFILTEI